MEDDVIIVSVKRKKIVVKDFIDLNKAVEQKVTVWTVPPCKSYQKKSKTKM